MERIGIIFDGERKPEAKKLGLEIKQLLESDGCKVFLKLTDNVLKNGLDFVITLGGDGLVFHAADKVAKFKVPLFRVNFGEVGYLCDIEPMRVFEKLEKLLNNKFQIEKLTRIRAKVYQDGKIVRELDALNEIDIGGMRTVSLEMLVKDKEKSFKTKIKGSGVIFSTKTGSTAYNINAGGSVLITDVLSIVANNGLFKSDFLLPNTKAFISSIEAVFNVRSLNSRSVNLPYLIADGQRDYKLKSNDLVVIEKSLLKTLFIKVE